MNEDDSIKMIYPDGYTTSDITIKCMNNVIRRARIGKAVEILAIPVVIAIVGISIWKNKK